MHHAEERCRAALFTGTGHALELQSFAKPSPVAGDQLVKVRCCTLCGSDLHTVSGRRTQPTPAILGHETVGEVVAGEAVTDLRGDPVAVGDRIVWSIIHACKRCAPCLAGLPQKCERLRKFGHQATSKDGPLFGGLAEYCQLPAGTDVVRLDDHLVDEVACMASCATATAMSAWRHAGYRHDGRVPDGPRVMVLGAGLLGLNLSAIASTSGAASVTVVDRLPDRRRLAERFGATRLLDWEAVQQELADSHQPEPYDFVFEMTGNPDAVAAAIAIAAIGGTVVLVGSVFPSQPVPISPEQIVRRHLTLRGIHNYAPVDLLAAVDFLQANATRFPFEATVDRTYPLEQVNQAIEYAAQHRPIRVAVSPLVPVPSTSNPIPLKTHEHR